MMASNTSSMPFPVLADTYNISEIPNPNVDWTWAATFSGWAPGRSI
jgi:hypothetical protein